MVAAEEEEGRGFQVEAAGNDEEVGVGEDQGDREATKDRGEGEGMVVGTLVGQRTTPLKTTLAPKTPTLRSKRRT